MFLARKYIINVLEIDKPFIYTVNPRYLDLAYLDTPLCRHNFKSPAETIHFSVKNPPLSRPLYLDPRYVDIFSIPLGEKLDILS